jgi:hypothetical protein
MRRHVCRRRVRAALSVSRRRPRTTAVPTTPPIWAGRTRTPGRVSRGASSSRAWRRESSTSARPRPFLTWGVPRGCSCRHSCTRMRTRTASTSRSTPSNQRIPTYATACVSGRRRSPSSATTTSSPASRSSSTWSRARRLTRWTRCARPLTTSCSPPVRSTWLSRPTSTSTRHISGSPGSPIVASSGAQTPTSDSSLLGLSCSSAPGCRHARWSTATSRSSVRSSARPWPSARPCCRRTGRSHGWRTVAPRPRSLPCSRTSSARCSRPARPSWSSATTWWGSRRRSGARTPRSSSSTAWCGA